MLIVGDCNYQKSTGLIFQNQYITASLHISSENLDYFPTRKQRNDKKLFLENFIPSFSKKTKGSNYRLSFHFPASLN